MQLANIKITQDSGNTISIYVNGFFVTKIVDLERPYTNGKIGLYTEDARACFDDIAVDQ